MPGNSARPGRRFAGPGVVSLLLASCTELNPPRPPPDHAVLAPGGVWVAYNLGCERGCDDIKRGDRILAVDGRPVSSGAELDAIGLASGRPLALKVAKYDSLEVRDVTLQAAPNDNLPPLDDMPPLLTVGAAALDRAPAWARSRLFGHTIPALRFLRADEPRGFVNGRELYGRAAVLVVWGYPAGTREERRLVVENLPQVYAHLQDQADELEAASVDTYFIHVTRADPALRDYVRSKTSPPERGYLPIFELASLPGDGNTLGIQGGAADIRETLLVPSVLVLDRRGIVRFHARGFPAGYKGTIAAALEFASHQLTDAPAAPQLAAR